SRADTFLERYFGATLEGNAAYVRAVSRHWLIALVARALEPGCEQQAVLILEGPQGAGKTRGLQAIAGQPYYLDTAIEIGNKDFAQLISSAWLVELGELASLQKAETNGVKSF